jgi:hypothetical protein
MIHIISSAHGVCAPLISLKIEESNANAFTAGSIAARAGL